MLTQKIFAAAQNGAEIILWLLIVVSFFSVALMIDRYRVLSRARKQSLKAQGRLQEALSSNNLDELEEISRDKDSLEGRALSYAFRHIKDKGASGAPELFNAFVMLERPRLERSLNFLATVGSNAPFVGLLGTVLGIMKAFNDMGVSQGNASAVMVGIAEALVATAVGLVVAIPAVIAYNYFQKQVRDILQALEGVREMFISYTRQKGN
jgi:biopolymer transport protein TolQ